MRLVFISLLLGIVSNAFALDPLIKDLRDEVVSLARTYEGKSDLDGKLQQEIELKVQELERVLPNLTMQEKAAKIAGPWRQVFGPYSATGDGKIPFGTDTANIYQIIFPEGFFYNVAVSKVSGLRAVILLKGEYKVTDEAIEGVFVRNSVLVRGIPSERLFELPAQLEAGTLRPVHLPRSLKPVGLGGQLLEVYADDEIRILRGKTESFVRPALYVMERAK